MNDRPNILFVFTDQQSATAMSCAGNPDLRTPAMDSLAAEGVRFDLGYCSQPLCTPSRASMFSGCLPHSIKTLANGAGIPPERRGQELGVLLTGAGYDCVYGGKWHVPEIAMPADNDHGFRVIGPWDDNRLTPACVEFLQRHAEQPAKERRPFFMVASYDDPHNVCEAARGQRLPWGPLPEPPAPADCPNLPANFAIPAYEPEIIRLEQAAHPMVYAGPRYSPDDWRRLRWQYFRLVERVDAHLARLLEALRQTGLEENTVVVFSSDHGDGHGAHQWNQKSVLYEESVRVPIIVRAPGGRKGAVDAERLASIGLDLLPTLCDYAGARLPEGLPGRSLRPLVEGTPAEWRDHLVIETRFDDWRGRHGFGSQGRCVRTARTKYVAYDTGLLREQLFDLVADPGEMVNLAVESRQRDRLHQHRALLLDHCRRTKDAFPVPGHETAK